MRLANSTDELPYGRWELQSGGEVIVNRFYQPIAEREPEGNIVPVRGGRYAIKRESWSYFSSCGERTAKTDRKTRDLCRKILVDFIEGRDVSESFRWTQRRMLSRAPLSPTQAAQALAWRAAPKDHPRTDVRLLAGPTARLKETR